MRVAWTINRDLFQKEKERTKERADEMDQHVKYSLHKPDSLDSAPGTRGGRRGPTCNSCPNFYYERKENETLLY